MKLSIGSDHGGFDLKEAIKNGLAGQGHEILDRGTQGHESVDYPDFGEAVARDVADGRADRGILICTTGIGISISANKVRGVRAAICHNEDAAEFCRRHNDANIICFGQKYDTPYMAVKMAEIFIKTEYEGGRHQRRLDKISVIEQEEGR